MSRVINIDSLGKQRAQLVKAIAVAVRELARQSDTGAQARDLAAFLAIALQLIADGIEPSVAAWEKRGYWVKADKFRLEWEWTAPTAQKMRSAVLANDWGTVARLAAEIAQRFGRVQVAPHHRLGTPWVGAFQQLSAK